MSTPRLDRFLAHGLEISRTDAQRLVRAGRVKVALSLVQDPAAHVPAGAEVLVDERPVNSCLMLAVEADGARIRTIEGEARAGTLSPLQQAFVEHHAVQCGFCTPGMLISAQSLLERTPHPTDPEIIEAIAGNLCRCTGYTAIVSAIRATRDRTGGAR